MLLFSTTVAFVAVTTALDDCAGVVCMFSTTVAFVEDNSTCRLRWRCERLLFSTTVVCVAVTGIADCAGVVNGTTVLDDCGVCGGDNSTCTDCAGVVNGTSVLDDCGVCGGDGSSCADPCAAAGQSSPYTLTIEASAPADATTPGTVYRFYVNANDATDKLSAVFGNDQSHLIISTPEGIFNSAFNSSWSASGHQPIVLGLFPDMADDSYATINLTGPASEAGAGAADASLVEDSNLSPTISGYFIGGGTELNVNTLTGASWYLLNTAANALPNGDRWLIAQ